MSEALRSRPRLLVLEPGRMVCGTPALGLDVCGASDALCDGDLCAAVSEVEFPDKVRQTIQSLRHDRRTLSQAVHARLGEVAFRIARRRYCGG